MLEHATKAPTRVEPTEALNEYFTVTVFPTQHCPGSIAFIFEGYFGKYIYVGDMRLEMSGEAGESILFEVEMNVPSAIPWSELEGADRLFMDTTFASAEWERLPGRMEALEAVLDLIDSKSEKRQILLECDMLGTEQVLHAVHEHFGSLIYADPALFRKLEGVPGNEKFLTTNRSETRFMVVPAGSLSQKNLDRKRSASDIDRHVFGLDAFALKPSTQWFGSVARTKTVDFTPKLHDGVWHVPFSIHGSFSEIRRFIAKIRPKSVTPLTSIARPDLVALQQLCQPSRRSSLDPDLGASRESSGSNLRFSIPDDIAGAMRLAKVPVASSSVESSDDEGLITHGREDLHHVLDDSSVDFSVSDSLHEGHVGTPPETPASAAIVDPKHWTPNSKPIVSLFGDVYSTDVSIADDEATVDLNIEETEHVIVMEDKTEKKRSAEEIPPLPSSKRKCEALTSLSAPTSSATPSIFDLMYSVQSDDLYDEFPSISLFSPLCTLGTFC